MEWISVDDGLPELEEDVLLFDSWETQGGEKMKDVRVGYLSEYTTRKSFDDVSYLLEWKGTEYAFNITHWMPLPEPPKEIEND